MGNFAFDEFSWDGRGGLLADCDADSCFNEFCDIALGCVVGDAAHWDIVALGECYIEDGSRTFSVFEEHFVEIAKAEKEHDIIG